MRRIPTISIVDDDDAVLGSVVSFLRSAGFGAQGFRTAEAFLASPSLTRTDCLVTDLHMPGMNGVALQRHLRSIGFTAPIIVMTAYPTPAARQSSADLGAAALLPKPVDPDRLLDQIELVLS
ncbi:MAG TPA: response regulator [Aliidongia sp.]|nr:response regulator [Aliidongia sp.]